MGRAGRDGEIAIVGMACRFPGAPSLSAYWRLVREGRNAFGPVPADRWNHDAFFSTVQRAVDRYYVPTGGFIDDVRSFAAMEFAIPPRRVEVMDPQQRLALECAWHALVDAGYAATIDNANNGRPLDRRRVGTYLGLCAIEFRVMLATRITAQLMAVGDLGEGAGSPEEAKRLGTYVDRVVPSRAFSAPGVLGNMAAAAVAQELDLGGPAFTLDAACASALVAVHDAITYLRSGQVDAALAGGVYVNLTPEHLVAFSRIGAISAKGNCRPFDAAADGFVQGEGVGFVMLKRLEDALRDADRIYAVIRGTGCNNDGRGDGPMSPRQEGQEAVIAEAWRDAGLDAREIGYVEAHGTGTSVGDKTELSALRAALAGRGHGVPLGSAKANIGHTMSAAGIAGLVKAALAVHHAEVPPLANWATPHPDHDLDDGVFSIPTAASAWSGTRVATVSSFGFGGTNAHLVLQAAPDGPRTRLRPEAPPPPVLPGTLVILSADDGALLGRYCREVAESLGDDADLEAVAHTLNLGRKRRSTRACIVASTLAELRGRLRKVAGILESDPAARGAADRDTFVGDTADPVPVAFLCPGQGMQRVGMLREWLALPEFAATLEAMERAVADITPRPLREYIYAADATEDALTDTAIAQPAMFAIGMGVAAVLRRFGIEPAVVLGHSLGEFTASALSGAVDPEAAIRFVALRGRAMSDMPGDHGAMAAVMAAAEEIAPHLPPDVVIANRNHPRQNVLSGPTAAVDATVQRLLDAGLKARRIPVSHAFHSPMLEAVQGDVDTGLGAVEFAAPRTPMASCVAAEPPRAAADVRAIYARHAVSPVDYVRGLTQCQELGARIFVQLAGGATLCAFARGSVPEAEAIVSVAHDDDDRGTGLLRILAMCAAHGHRVDLRSFGSGLASIPPTPVPTEVYWPIQPAPVAVGVALQVATRAEAPAAPARAVHGAEAVVAHPASAEATVEERVLKIVSRVSAFPVEALRAEQKLIDDLGFDSLMANELGTRLAEDFPGFAGIPRSLFASSPTLSDLVRHVEGAPGGPELALSDPARAMVGYAVRWVEAPLSGLSRKPGRVMVRPTLHELRNLPPGDLIVVGEALGSNPGTGGLAGFVKALAREWSGHKVCLVDGTPEDGAAESAAAERDVEVRYAGGTRFVPGLFPVEPATRTLSGARVLVTGGTGWLGRQVARALVAEGARVILLGTRADPGDALAELGAAGTYVRADVRGVLPKLEVDGIVHAAGVLADGPVGTADPTSAWTIKVDGLANLREAFPHAWIACMGSYAGRFGNAYQTEYAAANEAMAALARRLGVTSMAWSGQSDMVGTIPLAARRELRDDGTWFVDTQQGLRALLAHLGTPGEVVMGLDLPPVRRCVEVEEVLDPGLDWLRDHALLGRPTVPMAMVMEWASRLGGGDVEIHDLTLYDGVVVEKPTVVRRRLDGDRFTAWSGGRLAWRARVVPLAGELAASPPTGGEPSPMPLSTFYAEHTFHGPTLQGIVAVDGVGADFVRGKVRVGSAEDWARTAGRSGRSRSTARSS